MNELIEKIKGGSYDYGSIPFWSWNDRLDPERLRKQIRDMKALNMKGFFMHARGGLETEYMSDEWYDCIEASIDEAKKLGMEAWAYDENGWPSGFAGGKLLEDPENFAVYIEGDFFEEYPNLADDTLVIYAFDKKGIPTVCNAPVDECKKYLLITMKFDGSYVDTMREDIIDKFIEATHEKYKKRFYEDFGGTMPGFFTDEPQYYRWRTPYSIKMDEWFVEEYGYSVKEALPSLFCDYEGAETYRYDYHKMTNKKFTESFSKRLYDWHEQNGARLTGHFVEESTLYGQMMCCGDIMPQYQYEHIPGIDYLGRRIQSDVAPKQLGSVCAQLGRKKALSEMFGCCGWDVTPRELKSIAELQYVNGINVMCQHLYPYSIRGQRKRDYPAFYSEHSLWKRDQATFNEFFNRLGYTLAMGEEYADTLLIHPMHSAWLYFKRIEMKTSVKDLDDELVRITELLSGNGVAYHFGSEAIMKNIAYVENGKMIVGKCVYKTVIVPPCDTLDRSTVELIERFKAEGGKVLTSHNRIPNRIDGRRENIDVLANCDNIFDPDIFSVIKNDQKIVLDRAEKDTKIRVMTRETELGKIIYVVNLSVNDTEKLRLTVKDCNSLGELDLSSLTVKPLVGRRIEGGVEIEFELEANGSVLFCECDAPNMLDCNEKENYIKLGDAFRLVEAPQNMMALDRARVSRNGGAFGELMPIERIRDELLSDRFNGQLTLSFPFEVREIPETLSVISEFIGAENLRVNGNKVKIGSESAIDPSFKVTDIAKFITVGENTVEFSIDYWQSDYVYYVLYGGVSETLRNCLVFDTEIENIYLFGGFSLDMKRENFIAGENNSYRYDPRNGMTLVRQNSAPDVRNVVTDGYPFYCGEISYEFELDYRLGDPSILRLDGRYATIGVCVNGESAGTILLSRTLDIKKYLKTGKNVIRLTLCNNYRNLFGPHHRAEGEPLSVSPKSFSFEGKWIDGKCEEFDPGYSFVRFGIDI